MLGAMSGQVLVIGAGPTGLTAACVLSSWGIHVRVVDAAEAPFAGSRGKGMQPRTLEILDNLGVSGRLIATGRSRLLARHYHPDGSFQLVDLNEGAEPGPDSPYGRSLIIPQWRTEQVLRELLASHGVEVEWDRGVTELEQNQAGVVARFADGTEARADYAIGCDGGSSTVRRLLGVPFLGETTESVRMLVGDVELEGLDRDHWHIWLGENFRGVALCPLPATDTFQFQAPLPPGQPDEPSLANCQRIVDDVIGPGRVRLRRATWLSRWRLNVRMVDRYRVGRVFLAGDAAHVHSPAGGQGLNTGVQDAANLGWKLAHVLAGAPESLLDTYQAERLPVAAGVLGLSNRLLDKVPGARPAADRAEALQLGVSYRGGPLAPRVDADGPNPGDRAPDAPCRTATGEPVRLFELFRGPHWTLLDFGHPDRHALGIPTVYIGRDVIDREGHARRAYAARDGELVLVRPDGYIGTRSLDAAEIAGYLGAAGAGVVNSAGTDSDQRKVRA